jgi:excisionase family DNA binding protein
VEDSIVNEPEQYVPIENVAKHFSVSISTIRAWIRQGKIPKGTFMKLGTTYRFKLSAVESALVNGPAEVTKARLPDEITETKQPINLY